MKPGGETETMMSTTQGDTGKKQDSYIWRTTGDGKVRSLHAERDGKTFSWDHPPEGGHPGEAYNCRCRAEERDCTNEKFKVNKIRKKRDDVSAKVSQLKTLIHNKKLKIRTGEAILKDWEDRGLIGVIASGLSRSSKLIIKGIGIAGELAGAPSGMEIIATWEQLKKDKAELRDFEEELRPLENEMKNLEAELKYAEEKLEQCQAGP